MINTVVVLLGLGLALSPGHGLPLEGDAAEAFLRTARVVQMTPIGVGITNPMKVTLTDGTRTHHAVWKTVDEVRHGVHRAQSGRFQQAFRDSYKFEVAAYELDKLLQLGLVPPTVEREIDGRVGSLQMWVDGAFTELDRQEQHLEAPDVAAWSHQVYRLRLMHQLIYNDDANNIRNVLYDPSFRVYAIDNSRSFRAYGSLANENGLRRFSRALLTRLEQLSAEELSSKLGAWLNQTEIDALIARRDLLLARARSLADDLGEAAVYYP